VLKNPKKYKSAEEFRRVLGALTSGHLQVIKKVELEVEEQENQPLTLGPQTASRRINLIFRER
jgi:hypothetical protein